jgi:hypothetical protein
MYFLCSGYASILVPFIVVSNLNLKVTCTSTDISWLSATFSLEAVFLLTHDKSITQMFIMDYCFQPEYYVHIFL